MLLARVVLPLLVAGCTALPPKTATVTWAVPGCQQTRTIRFVDSNAPFWDCVVNLRGGDQVLYGTLLLLGVPPAACAMIYPDLPAATVYMSLQSPGAELWAAGTLHSPESLLAHETDRIIHDSYEFFAPWLHDCSMATR
jgi:hypothetical protein